MIGKGLVVWPKPATWRWDLLNPQDEDKGMDQISHAC